MRILEGSVARFYIVGLLLLALSAYLLDLGGVAEVLLSLAGIGTLAALLFTLARRELGPLR